MAIEKSTCTWALLALAASFATPALAQPDSGKAVFARVCEPCHGPGGNGDSQGPALVPFKKDLPELIAIVRQGVGLMPAIPRSEMSDAEIEQVHAYLKSLTTSGALHRHALVRHRSPHLRFGEHMPKTAVRVPSFSSTSGRAGRRGVWAALLVGVAAPFLGRRRPRRRRT